MSTFFMNLTLPTPRTTAATTWASNINTALTSIDSHSHISGEGQRLTVAGIDVDSDIPMGDYSLTNVNSFGMLYNLAASVDNQLHTTNGNLAFRDDASNDILLTSGGAIAIAAGVGVIKGDYASTGATVFYTNSTLSYDMEDSLSALASIRVKDVVGVDLDASSISTATVTGVALNATTANLQGTTTVSGAATFSGSTSGRGIIPVGAVVGLASNLTGVSLPSSMLELNGQVITDVDSPMNGVVLPNVSGSRFLMGSTTAGTSGGAATYTLSSTQLPAHTHTINNSHANTLAVVNPTVDTSTHTHNIAHAHMWMRNGRSLTAEDDSQTTITSTNGTKVFNSTSDRAATGGAPNSAYTVYDFETFYTSGVLSPPSGSDGATAASDTPSTTQTITLSGAVTDHSGSSGSSGTGSAYSLLPSYITTRYIIRFK